MKRWLLVPLVLMLLAGGLAGWGWRQWTRAPGASLEGPVRVRVVAGMTLGAAADTLEARGLLERRVVLLAGARLSGRSRALRTGLYEFDGTESPRDLLDVLMSGRSVLTRVTIPEGLDADEIAEVVRRTVGCAPGPFLAAADSLVRAAVVASSLFADAEAVADHDALLAGESRVLPRRLRWCEGYLAPDTYFFGADVRAVEVAAHLVAVQLDRLATASGLAGPGGPTGHGLLTLASIVESEARQDEERGRIAAVYTNRLAAGWRLEADPTVAYLLGRKGRRLFYRDLETDSAWNTYRRRGLPPGPIGSPGLASLLAAADPDTACDAFFFVSDGGRGHVFSRTAQEHERAVRRFRQVRDEDRRRQAD